MCVVALTGSAHGEHLVRRAARMAARSKGDLIALHVRPQDGLASGAADQLDRQRELVEEFGGTYREVVGADIGEALVSAARTLNATQIVLGATQRTRLAELARGSVINRVIRDSGVGLDVHVISRGDEGAQLTGQRARRPSAVPRRRVVLGLALAAIGLPILTWVLSNLGDHVGLPSVLLIFLLLVVTVSAIGGVWPALTAAVAGFLLVNWYFTPPIHTFTIADGENLLALSVFLAVAAVVSGFVSLAARRAADGSSARGEATALAGLAGSTPVPALLADLRRILALDVVAVFHRADGQWTVAHAVGAPVPTVPVEPRIESGRGPRARHGWQTRRDRSRGSHPRRLRARDRVLDRARGARVGGI